MLKKKLQDLDKPVTRRDLLGITDTMQEIAGFIMKEMKKGFSQIRKEFRKEISAVRTELKEEIQGVRSELKMEIADFRLAEKLNWEDQKRFNKEIAEKVDLNTESVVALDKRVRYQDDLPERLEHVENQQYELTRRVAALEK
ncbi:MAG: hypothetical protein O3A36_00410 [bacterium]|nr:hypothetical protein [bacterium]